MTRKTRNRSRKGTKRKGRAKMTKKRGRGREGTRNIMVEEGEVRGGGG